jgi:CRISPR-associated protein Csb1
MNAQRTVLEVDLAPVAGRRFQPTGFPDLGPAEFDSADGNRALLVESAQGYGTVPHHRVEYTASAITAYFTIDHAQFRSYGLSEPATGLLAALADFEIGTLLDGGLRLRTACDLRVLDVRGQRPDAEEAAARVAKLATDCSDELGPVTEITWSRGK